MKVKATTSHSAEYTWIANNQHYGMIQITESAAYDCSSTNVQNTVLEDPSSVIVVCFRDVLPSISREDIDNRKVR